MRYTPGVALFALATLAACSSNPPKVTPIPDSAWQAAVDSPRSSYPRSRAPSPVPATGGPLNRNEVLDITLRKPPYDAIAEIDRHPLAFPLDAGSIAWFEDRVIPPEVIDYLRKRAQVNWLALRGAADSPRTTDPEMLPSSRTEEPTPSFSEAYDTAPPTMLYGQSPEVVVVQEPQTTIVYDGTQPYVSSYVGTGYVWFGGRWYRPYNRSYSYTYGYSTGVVRSNAPRYPYTQGRVVGQVQPSQPVVRTPNPTWRGSPQTSHTFSTHHR